MQKKSHEFLTQDHRAGGGDNTERRKRKGKREGTAVIAEW